MGEGTAKTIPGYGIPSSERLVEAKQPEPPPYPAVLELEQAIRELADELHRVRGDRERLLAQIERLTGSAKEGL